MESPQYFHNKFLMYWWFTFIQVAKKSPTLIPQDYTFPSSFFFFLINSSKEGHSHHCSKSSQVLLGMWWGTGKTPRQQAELSAMCNCRHLWQMITQSFKKHNPPKWCVCLESSSTQMGQEESQQKDKQKAPYNLKPAFISGSQATP